jgi:glutamyl-tRNA reductase
MDGYVSVGVSWQSADLRTLERLAVDGRARDSLQQAALEAGCSEAFVLSTCSRTELHVVHEATVDHDLLRRLLADLDAHDPQATAGLVAVREGTCAVSHLFRVASGLASRAMGEVEIRAQLRSAARGAVAARGEPHRLRHLVAAALTAAREGPTPTLGTHRGMLSRRAVSRTLRWAGGRRELEVLVVGTGTMGRQVVAALDAERCTPVLLSRRTGATGGGHAEVRPLEELPARIRSADAVFVATSAGRHLLTREVVQAAMDGRDRPLALVDLSVPRNVDPAVSREPGVTLFDLDDLNHDELVPSAPAAVLQEAERAAAAAARAYLEQLRIREAGPLITELRTRLEDVCLDKLRDGLRSSGLPDEALRQTAQAVARAVAHPPTLLLRTAAGRSDGDLLSLLVGAFELRTTDDPARESISPPGGVGASRLG